jgi:hypothetical protein
MLNSVDAVIEALGGNTSAASLASVGASAVSNWRARGEIPPENFLLFRDALKALGKEIDPAVFGFKVSDEARA